MATQAPEWRVFLASQPSSMIRVRLDVEIYNALLQADDNAWWALLEFLWNHEAA